MPTTDASMRSVIGSPRGNYSALPEPMLARSGRLPTRGDYAYQLKWDGLGVSGRLRWTA
jgi:hypothetical protein